MTSITDPALVALALQYAPYDQLAAFAQGLAAHDAGDYVNPYDGRPDATNSVNAQAWDRGAECAARFARGVRCIPDPVPAVTERPRTLPRSFWPAMFPPVPPAPPRVPIEERSGFARLCAELRVIESEG